MIGIHFGDSTKLVCFAKVKCKKELFTSRDVFLGFQRSSLLYYTAISKLDKETPLRSEAHGDSL